MPFKPPERVMCPKCGDAVYHAESVKAAGTSFHKKCFKCDLCGKALESTNVAEHELKLFCKQCHGRKYGPKGYGYGSGAGALGMDSGERFGNKTCEMDNKPRGNPLGGGTGTDSGTGPKCPRCGKTVYDAERAIGAAVPWHKSCFNCNSCHKSIDSSTMATHDGEVYCKACYGKNFGPKGFGFGQGAGTLSMG